jgi:hypothetical protein
LVSIWVNGVDKRRVMLIEKEMDVNLGEEDEHEMGVEYVEEELKVFNRSNRNVLVLR